MNPSQVLDCQADLLVRLRDPIVRRTWTEHLAMNVTDGSEQAVDDDARSSGAAGVYALGRSVTDAACYFVSDEMSMLVQYAASQLDDTDRLDHRLAPTRSGIARFDRPMPMRDIRGREMLIGWVVWGPVHVQYARQHDLSEPEDAIGVWLFNDHRDAPDEIAQFTMTPDYLARLDHRLGRWGLIGMTLVSDGVRLGPSLMEPRSDMAARVLAEGDMPHAHTNASRLVHAFWLMLGQTVADVRDADVDRATRKRMGRIPLPARVVVIRLRRHEGSRSEGETYVEWSHRWVVRGHWRNQFCGHDHPLAQEIEPGQYRARIWIAPYVKGPDGKPLVVSEKVYGLVR